MVWFEFLPVPFVAMLGGVGPVCDLQRPYANEPN